MNARTPENSLMQSVSALEADVAKLRKSLDAREHPSNAQSHVRNIEGRCSMVNDHLTRILRSERWKR